MTQQDLLYEPVPEILEKVRRTRERLHLSDSQCPCAPKESGRGCVGAVCLAEIFEQGHCKCGAFKRKETSKNDTVHMDRGSTC